MIKEAWGQRQSNLQVFVSSPDDVEIERNSVNEVIEVVNRTIGQKVGLTLNVRRWELFRPRGENVMDFIERQMKECDLFIMIFSRRFGSSSPSAEGEYSSGTVTEYDIARDLRAKSKTGRPEIFVYFKKIEDTATLRDPGPELKQILAFKEKLKPEVFYKEYHSAETFRLLLKDHLVEWILDIIDIVKANDIGARKRSVMENLFCLGSIPGEKPSALIVYPPIEKSVGDITHLLPYMVLEDFQAIHKLTKVLNISGCDNVRAMTTEIYDERCERKANKIFLCLPRNQHAKEYLLKIKSRRFAIERMGPSLRKNVFIKWRRCPGKNPIRVISPQPQYLQFQRKNNRESTWKHDPGKCLAVDFAVVSRFPDPMAESQSDIGQLSVLFVFGIRGLGTWGAAWYLDRCFEKIFSNDFKQEKSYQALLQVTYWNHRIREVINVSDQRQKYFDNEINEKTIKRRIRKYCDIA